MNKLVILNLGKGSLQNGFPLVIVSLQSGDRYMQFTGSLAPAPDLVELYHRWQLLYELLYKARAINIRSFQTQLIDEDINEDEDDDITIDEADVTHVSDTEFDAICQQLQNRLDDWLDFEGFRPIERQLRKQLHPTDEIEFIIQTEDCELRKLPWYIWKFFHDYPRAEVSLSSLNFEPGKQVQNRDKQVRILAVLGDSTGIDTKADRQLLENLTEAETVFLVEPQRRELDEKLWDKQGWDILFFAGHSCTANDHKTGHIYINPLETLTISQLKNALKKAIERGLQLAIFNSCEGLGLAAQLADLHIPQMIVMREPVTDQVAQEFLKHFLTIFADGQSFYLAMREARERLQGIESECPGASWLPVIFQNPAQVPPTWQSLREHTDATLLLPSVPQVRPKFGKVVLASIAIATLIIAGRWLGILQSSELKAFDNLMTQQPRESGDRRILIVGADEEDISSSRYGYPLPDDILAKLLNKLQTYQPSVIGIDIFRDQPVPINDPNSHQALVVQMEENQNLVAVCAGTILKESIAPPPEISPQQVGFVDLYDDWQQTKGQDDIVRRHLLTRSPNTISKPSRCTTSYSFGWQLVYRYLDAKGITVETIDKDWKFGSIVTKRLQSRSGGYQNLDAKGNQLLINYRHTPEIAQQVTVRDVLNDSDNFNPAWVKDRVVLIGITAQSVPDVHDTPYGEIRGLFIHAHAVSQILSAVEENRPLLWWLPQWVDGIFIFFWSFTGGMIFWLWQSPLRRGLAVSIGLIFLYGVCWFVLTKGGWIPLIPSVLALVFTGFVVVFFSRYAVETKSN
ncbi:MAG: CHASE2 domain-containing protein [Symploca sp. SIO2B6]|nr:CHASE2 domain-containing protein [Symploca sp. SIO2B6]